MPLTQACSHLASLRQLLLFVVLYP
jgi:hypothetical protein